MALATYHQGHWRAEVTVDELASGKFQGIVLLLHEGEPTHEHEQVVHRTVNVSDTVDGALAEANVLARHVLGNLH
jgi:hypothetical protein